MDNTLRLQIVTPDATAYSEDVEMVTLPAFEGQIGILPQHIRVRLKFGGKSRGVR